MMRMKQLVMMGGGLVVMLVIYLGFRGSSHTHTHTGLSAAARAQGFSLKNSPDLSGDEGDNMKVPDFPDTRVPGMKVSDAKSLDTKSPAKSETGNSNIKIETVKDSNETKSVKKSTDTGDDIVAVAKKVSQFNGTVLVTMINDAYLPFTYSWLCNTKEMNVHKSVLIITTDTKSKESLQRDWPEISVVAMEMANSGGDQVYSHVGYVKIMIRRTEMLDAIVQAGIEIFIFEVDCLWFTNPVPEMQKMKGFDILVNPVAERKDVYAGGFLYLYKTEKGRKLWKELTDQMKALGKRISKLSDDKYISEGDNDQQYLSALVTKRFGDIAVKVLPLDIYADGKWYEMSEEQRKKSHPLIVNNNWVLGNKGKIDRAKKWKHWFIKDDKSCDMNLVHDTIYKT